MVTHIRAEVCLDLRFHSHFHFHLHFVNMQTYLISSAIFLKLIGSVMVKNQMGLDEL